MRSLKVMLPLEECSQIHFRGYCLKLWAQQAALNCLDKPEATSPMMPLRADAYHVSGFAESCQLSKACLILNSEWHNSCMCCSRASAEVLQLSRPDWVILCCRPPGCIAAEDAEKEARRSAESSGSMPLPASVLPYSLPAQRAPLSAPRGSNP